MPPDWLSLDWLRANPIVAVGAGVVALLLLLRVGALAMRLLVLGIVVAAAVFAYRQMA